MVRTGSIHEANSEDRVDGMIGPAVGNVKPEGWGSGVRRNENLDQRRGYPEQLVVVVVVVVMLT